MDQKTSSRIFVATLLINASWLLPRIDSQEVSAKPDGVTLKAPATESIKSHALQTTESEDETLSPPVVALSHQLNAMLEAKRPEQAKVLLRQYRLHNQCHKDFYLAVARVSFDNRAYKQASEYLAEGLEKHPRSLALHLLNARTWLKVGELDLAEPELRICLSISPNSQMVHAELAKVLNEREDYASALKEIDTAIAAGPGDADIWTTRGNILRNMGRTREAVEALDQAVKLSHHVDYNIRRMRVSLLKRLGRYDEAIEEYFYLNKVDPKHDHLGYTDIGDCYMAMKNPKEALKYYDLALKRKSDYLAGHRGRLAALESLQDAKEAEQERKFIRQIEEDFTPTK